MAYPVNSTARGLRFGLVGEGSSGVARRRLVFRRGHGRCRRGVREWRNGEQLLRDGYIGEDGKKQLSKICMADVQPTDRLTGIPDAIYEYIAAGKVWFGL